MPTPRRRPLPAAAPVPRAAIAALLVALLPAPTHAQAIEVGRLSEIRRIGELQGCPPRARVARAGPTGEAVVIRRSAARLVAAEGSAEPVRIGDSVQVQREADVRVLLTTGQFGRGALYLAPQLLCAVRDVERVVPGSADRGEYTISTEPARDSGGPFLALAVERGAAYVQWSPDNGKPLYIYAPGGPFRVDGTEIVIVVDSAGAGSMLFVRSGVVSFRAAPGLRARAGQLFRLRPGARPQPVPLASRDALREITRDIDFHARDVWSLPARPPARRALWQRPGLWIGTAVALGAGVAVYEVVHSRGNHAPPPPTGIVTVHLPL